MSCHATSCHVMHVMYLVSRHATPCHVKAYHVMSRHVTLRHVTSCYVISLRKSRDGHTTNASLSTDFFHTQPIQIKHDRVRWLSRRLPIPYRISGIWSSCIMYPFQDGRIHGGGGRKDDCSGPNSENTEVWDKNVGLGMIDAWASSSIFFNTFCVKPYVPREPRRDPSNRRLNEHGITFTLHYIISQRRLLLKWPVVHQQSHIRHS